MDRARYDCWPNKNILNLEMIERYMPPVKKNMFDLHNREREEEIFLRNF